MPDAWESAIAGAAAAGISAHLILRHAFDSALAPWPLHAVLAVGAPPLLYRLLKRLWALEPGADLLGGLSIAVSIAMGEPLVGSILVLMMSGGAALERFASGRASAVLDALARRMPTVAHKKTGAVFHDVALAEVRPGDLLVVFPHESCPADGIVVEGHGTMDESYLTGEPYEISKTPGSTVLSGGVNGEAALTIQAQKAAADSRYAGIMKIMGKAETDRPAIRRLGDRLGAWYAPAALAVAFGAWLISGDKVRFLAVLVAATPCPLLIAIPVAVIGGISLAAQRGIVIKNPAVFERLSRCKTVILDKTGTLTYGKPALTEVVCARDFTREEALHAAASLERYSRHPLAKPILKAAADSALAPSEASEVSEKAGEGLSGLINGHRVLVTGRGRAPQAAIPAAAGGMECLVYIEGRFAALLRFRDEPRAESKSFLQHLGPRHSVQKVMLVSGDREEEARYLAGLVGVTEIHAGKSPEEKVDIVMRETKAGDTLFIGDGINDAPALMAATVGVAMGANSDVTSEAAGAVILTASIAKVDELFHLCDRMRAIALQSAVGGMAASAVCMLAAALGFLPPLEGAVAQEVIDLAAVLNAVRVALPPRDLTDF